MQSDRENWQTGIAQHTHLQSLSAWLDSNDIGWTAAQLFEKLGKPGYCLVVVASASSGESAPDVGGCLLAQTIVDETTLLAIAVRSDCRRTGLGRQMIDALSEHAIDSGSKAILLEVRESNGRAINFYQSLGFEKTGERKNYYPGLEKEHRVDNVLSVQRESALLFRLTL